MKGYLRILNWVVTLLVPVILVLSAVRVLLTPLYIQIEYRLPGFQEFERFHPLFLYESLWNLMNMGVLLLLERKYKDHLKQGDLFFIYLIIYPLGRFLLEFIRLNSAEIGGINANQTFMLVVAIASAAAIFIRHKVNDQPKLKR